MGSERVTPEAKKDSWKESRVVSLLNCSCWVLSPVVFRFPNSFPWRRRGSRAEPSFPQNPSRCAAMGSCGACWTSSSTCDEQRETAGTSHRCTGRPCKETREKTARNAIRITPGGDWVTRGDAGGQVRLVWCLSGVFLATTSMGLSVFCGTHQSHRPTAGRSRIQKQVEGVRRVSWRPPRFWFWRRSRVGCEIACSFGEFLRG